MSGYYRARAPLRLGLGGGGTDLAAYSSRFGGAILNATISMYATASIEILSEDYIEFISPDRGCSVRIPYSDCLDVVDDFQLHCGVYNRLVKDFDIPIGPFRLTTSVDAPPGSGLGSSSTLVVAMIAAFMEWQRLPISDYEVARLAYDIERIDLGMAGGKQDQFAATFGGVNFMEFLQDDTVLVNPLRIREELLCELEHQCILVHTKTSRYSSDIINEQIQAMTNQEDGEKRMQALHQVKNSAYELKKALLRGNFTEFGKAMHNGWLHKKKTASHITNSNIDLLYQAAIDAGALGGKVSGAGGGGFMFVFCDKNKRYSVVSALVEKKAEIIPFQFVQHGYISWQA